MSTIPIFLIDDNEVKQKWFFEIVNWLNTHSGCDYKFDPLWAEPASAVRNSVNHTELIEALRCEGAIYLVDLALNETAEEAALFRQSLVACKDSVLRRVATDFSLKLESAPSSSAPRDPMAMVIQRHRIATLFLMAAREKSRPTMFVSAQAEGDLITRVKDARLASVDYDRFPYEASPNEMYPDEQDRKAVFCLWGNRILSLLDPFTRIRELTASWFATDATCATGDYDSTGMPHNLQGRALSNLAGHEACVRSVLNWLPAGLSWWRSEKDTKALHEALKTFCGNHAGWMGRDHNAYPLSLAGAYLVFLMAVQARAPERLPQYCTIDWSVFFGSSAGNPAAKEAHAFLPKQESASAEQSIRCLYNFFLSIIVRTDNDMFGVGDLRPPSRDIPAFCLRLEWNVEDVSRFCLSVNARVAQSLSADRNALALPPGKAPGAFLRFLVASQASSCGVGAPGVIRLSCNPEDNDYDRRWLIIGSSSHDHR